MKINWKVRFKNPVFISSLYALVVSFVFKLLALFEIFPAISESTVMQFCDIVLLILVGTGVVTDPTTSGVGDSQRALTYNHPTDSENG